MKFFIGIFLLVGIGFLSGAYFSYSSTASFISTALSTTGVVVENRFERSTSSKSSSGVYYGYIKFNTAEGSSVTFRTSVGTNPPAFEVGESTKVYYDPKDPQSAQVNTFFQLWFLPILLGFIGFIFTIIPVTILCLKSSRRKREEWLRNNGDRVNAEFLGVEMDTSYSMNGQHPYIIKSQWLNPLTNQPQIFTSERLWYNPEEFVKCKALQVFIDRNNPTKYHVDLSNLPKRT